MERVIGRFDDVSDDAEDSTEVLKMIWAGLFYIYSWVNSDGICPQVSGIRRTSIYLLCSSLGGRG